MDIVYVLGKGSLCNNEELRYSLRSISTLCADKGNVFIVGEKVDFLEGVTFIEYPDAHAKPWKNILDKVRAVCGEESLSEDFLLMNDDFFALSGFTIEDLPYYATKVGNGGNSGPINFAVHTPVRLNKKLYLGMPINSGMSTGFSPRTFYCNLYRTPPTYIKDLVVRVGEGMPSFDEQIGDSEWFTIDDVAMLDSGFLEWLDTLYPYPSQYEIAKSE